MSNSTSYPAMILISLLLLAATPPTGQGSTSPTALADLPFVRISDGMSIEFPATPSATVVGAVSDTGRSNTASGTVVYGDLTGDAVGTFLILVDEGTVESEVALISAPPEVLGTLPSGGYRLSTTTARKVALTADTILDTLEGYLCAVDDDFRPPSSRGSVARKHHLAP